MNFIPLSGLSNFLAYIRRLATILKKIKNYPIVVLRANNVLTMSLILLKYLGIIRNKYIVLAEFNTSEKTKTIKSYLKYSIYRRILNACDLIFPFSETHADYYHRILMLPKHKLFVIHEATNYSPLSKYAPVCEGNSGHILVPGRTGRDYNTFAKAVETYEKKVLIVTNHRSVSGITFNENVSLMYDISSSELFELVVAAKYIVLPLNDSYHPVGLRMLLYAFERGKACIVTETKTIREYFPDEYPLKVVPANDPVRMRQAIEDFDLNPCEVKKRGLAGRALAEQKFTSEKYITQAFQKICYDYKEKKLN